MFGIAMSKAFVATVLFSLLAVAAASHSFKAYRFVQYDHDQSTYGSRRANVNMPATSNMSVNLKKKMLAVEAKDAGKVRLGELRDKNAGGLLLVLPKDLGSLSANEKAAVRALEESIVGSNVDFPAYVAKEDGAGEVSAFLKEVNSRGLQLTISSSEGSAIKSPDVFNVVAKLTGKSSESERPSIAVVASYDSLVSAPGMSGGADASASGAVAVLELARMFAGLYKDGSQGSYDIYFVLTSAGRLNYQGSKEWLRTVDPRLLEKLEFALCLEAVSSNKLHMHVSRSPAKDADVKRLHEDFSAIVDGMDLVHKKINVSDPLVYWEHEQFSRKRVLAATISSFEAATKPLHRGSVLDQVDVLSIDTLSSNIANIAEVLARRIFSIKNNGLRVFDANLAVNKLAVQSWIEALSSKPTAAAYSTKATAEAVGAGIEAALSRHLPGDVSRKSFTLSHDYVFYTSTVADVTASEAKNFTFDLVFTLSLLAYSFGLFVLLKGPTEAWAITMAFMSGKKHRS